MDRARVLLVGDDAEVMSALHLDLARAGSAPFSVPSPELLEALLPSIAPLELVLVLPAAPGPPWGAALATAASAAREGTRVILVAPSREVIEPLAAAAGAVRALARADVLARPLCVLDGSPPPPLPPPARAARGAASAALALPTVDLLALIDEELDRKPRSRPRTARVEVNVGALSEHNFYVGATRRIDSGGVFISTMLPPAVGSPLEVRLGLPDSRRVEVQGEVVFVRERGAGPGRESAGCGVKLTGLPGWAVAAIDLFMAIRPPILYVP